MDSNVCRLVCVSVGRFVKFQLAIYWILLGNNQRTLNNNFFRFSALNGSAEAGKKAGEKNCESECGGKGKSTLRDLLYYHIFISCLLVEQGYRVKSDRT